MVSRRKTSLHIKTPELCHCQPLIGNDQFYCKCLGESDYLLLEILGLRRSGHCRISFASLLCQCFPYADFSIFRWHLIFPRKSILPQLLNKKDIWIVREFSGYILAHSLPFEAQNLREKYFTAKSANHFCLFEAMTCRFQIGDHALTVCSTR